MGSAQLYDAVTPDRAAVLTIKHTADAVQIRASGEHGLISGSGTTLADAIADALDGALAEAREQRDAFSDLLIAHQDRLARLTADFSIQRQLRDRRAARKAPTTAQEGTQP